jgi:hypothetical protein
LVGTRDKYFIDFRLQTALYVLYGSGDGRSQLDYRYVGITHEGKSVRGLGQRLGEHASDQEKRGKWDRVNWFGFRKVIFEGKSPVGSLGPEVWRNETPIRIKDVIRDLEAVLSRLPGSTQALSNLKYAQEWKQLPLAELSHYRKLKRLLKGHDGATARLAKSVGIVAATRS